MPRAIFFDCFSGASGDMLMGALLDAGAPLDGLRQGLAGLGVSGWRLEASPVHRHGIRGTHARVLVDQAEPQPARNLADVESAIRAATLPAPVEAAALATFRRLADAEARVHGTTPDEVHFHEVGAVDALVDVVGVCLALHLLGAEPDGIFSTGLPLGSGWVRSEHGPLPAAAPATAELLASAGAPTRLPPSTEAVAELTTPTGAALLTALATFREPAFQRVERVGYGFGTRDYPWPNALRVWLGEVASPGPPLADTVIQIETNVDDATPEQLGFAMERLLEAGALDVAFTPLQMKKNRPGVLLRVLAPPARGRALAEQVLLHTSALGVRIQTLERMIADRHERMVETPWGPVRVKEKRIGSRSVTSPEYEDCASLARAAGVTLAQVYDAARSATE